VRAEPMNEAEWLAATDPRPMVDALRAPAPASQRKMRLLLCASCRDDWHLLQGSIMGQAVETAERQADRSASDEEMRAVRQGLARLLKELMGQGGEDLEVMLDTIPVLLYGEEPSRAAAVRAALAAARTVTQTVTAPHLRQALMLLMCFQTMEEGVSRRRQYMLRRCQLLRDIFGPLPFRPVTIEPSLLGWHEGLVVRLTQAAYDSRQMPAGTLEPERLAVLADALEEAGCTDKDILGHLREQGAVHVRGCWVIDRLTGRE
jgi:hypothetical protein